MGDIPRVLSKLKINETRNHIPLQKNIMKNIIVVHTKSKWLKTKASIKCYQTD